MDSLGHGVHNLAQPYEVAQGHLQMCSVRAVLDPIWQGPDGEKQFQQTSWRWSTRFLGAERGSKELPKQSAFAVIKGTMGGKPLQNGDGGSFWTNH